MLFLVFSNNLFSMFSSGHILELTWDVPISSGPGVSDPNCISYAYYSNVDFIKVHILCLFTEFIHSVAVDRCFGIHLHVCDRDGFICSCSGSVQWSSGASGDMQARDYAAR